MTTRISMGRIPVSMPSATVRDAAYDLSAMDGTDGPAAGDTVVTLDGLTQVLLQEPGQRHACHAASYAASL